MMRLDTLLGGTRAAGFVLVLMAAGCGAEDSDTPAPAVPDCTEAVSSYYAAGCIYYEDTGRPFSVDEVTLYCRNYRTSAPDYCAADVDAWLLCLANVPNPTLSDDDCDCGVERAAMLAACR